MRLPKRFFTFWSSPLLHTGELQPQHPTSVGIGGEDEKGPSPLIWFAVASAILYYLALPPVGWCWGIFFVPACWVPLIESPPSQLPRRFYTTIWGIAAAFWGGVLIWLPSPHWGIWFGWGALSAYLAIYFPLFLAVARWGVHSARVPILFVAPICWIGVEWFRFHLLGGFSFGSLPHTLYLQPKLIQLADLFGEYTVAAMIVVVGTLLGIGLFRRSESGSGGKIRRIAILGAGVVLALTIFYGRATLDRLDGALARYPAEEIPHIALLQDNEYLTFPVSHETEMRIHARYLVASQRVVAEHPGLDVVVWPEGTFALSFYSVIGDGRFDGMESLDAETGREQVESILAEQRARLDRWLDALQVPVILGGSTIELGPEEKRAIYNSAYWFGRSATSAPPLDFDYSLTESAEGPSESRPSKRYDKIKRVMFGEYVPFVDWLPDRFPIKTLCVPIGAGTRSGYFPVGKEKNGLVSICFESSLPHFLRREITDLEASEEKIDLILSISNDGWFFGAAENEIHQATYVFRAVENRRWFLAATHGGASMAIDPAGRIVRLGKKTDSCVLVEPALIRPNLPFAGWLHAIPPLCAGIVAAIFFVLGMRLTWREENGV